MQRDNKTDSALNVGDYVVIKQKVPGTGQLLADAQVVAMSGVKLTVVKVGSKDARTVDRSDVQPYKEVYGIVRPGQGAQPVINQIRK